VPMGPALAAASLAQQCVGYTSGRARSRGNRLDSERARFLRRGESCPGQMTRTKPPDDGSRRGGGHRHVA
jgi:hypothetical protein